MIMKKKQMIMKKQKSSMLTLIMIVMLCVISSCGSDEDVDLTITPDNITLRCNTSTQVNASEKVDSWISEDEFITGNLYSPSLNSSTCQIVAKHIGSTRIKAVKGGKTAYATVTVNPNYSLYDTPILEFSASKTTIKSKENHVFVNEDEETLQYRYLSGTHECVVTYLFKENKMCLVMVIIANYDHDTVTKFLSERYQADREVEDLYINTINRETATMYVMLVTAESGKSKISTISYFQDNSKITSK